MIAAVAASAPLAEAAPVAPAPPSVMLPGHGAAMAPSRDGSSAAMRKRASTRLTHTDESSAEAIATLKSELPELTGAAPWQPLDLPSGFSVRAFADGDRDATVRAPDGKSFALVSTAPLRAVDPDTGTLGPVDLQPVARADGFGPANGLAPVHLPKDLTQGIAVNGLKLGFPGAASAAAQPVASTVVWPNSLQDTDVVAQPVVQGLELSLALRSADSPGEIPMSLDLPSSAAVKLATTEANAGGLDIVGQDGRVIASISAPIAWDAEKTPVATSWTLDGRSPTLHVEHVGKDVAYPVAVDPVINDNRYGWDLGTRPWSFAPGPSVSAFYGDAGWGPGMYQRLTTPQLHYDGWQSYWYLSLEGRTASVRQVHGEAMNHDTGQNAAGGPATCTYLALNSAGSRTDLSEVWCDTYRNRSTNAGSWQVPHAAGNWAQVSIFASGLGTRGYFQQFVGVLVAALSDDDTPNPVTVTGPGGWTNNSTAAITATASDPGLGVRSITFGAPTSPGWSGAVTNPNGQCVECPTSGVQGSTTVQNLPDGANTVTARASDPAGNATTAATQVKVDRLQPQISVSNELLADLDPATGQYRLDDGEHLLHIAATETGTANLTSGVRSLRVAVDGVNELNVTQSCESCAIGRDYVFSTDNARHGEGVHHIVITTADAVNPPVTKEIVVAVNFYNPSRVARRRRSPASEASRATTAAAPARTPRRTAAPSTTRTRTNRHDREHLWAHAWCEDRRSGHRRRRPRRSGLDRRPGDPSGQRVAGPAADRDQRPEHPRGAPRRAVEHLLAGEGGEPVGAAGPERLARHPGPRPRHAAAARDEARRRDPPDHLLRAPGRPQGPGSDRGAAAPDAGGLPHRRLWVRRLRQGGGGRLAQHDRLPGAAPLHRMERAEPLLLVLHRLSRRDGRQGRPEVRLPAPDIGRTTRTGAASTRTSAGLRAWKASPTSCAAPATRGPPRGRTSGSPRWAEY